MKKINVGVIGFGMSAQVFHLPFLKADSHFNLVKILERSDNKSSILYPDIETVKDIESILSDDIDLVVVTTPNLTHYDFCKKALLANKHVVVEKPFTVSSEQAEELINLAKERNLILSVYHNRRFDGDFLTIKNIIENNILGRLVEYESHFDRFRNYTKDNWRELDQAGSGILYDLGSHLIDQAITLFGLPESVYADIRIQRDKSSTDDNFEIILNYPDLKVSLKAGMLVREPLPRFILNGTNGSFIKYGLDPQEEMLKNGHKPIGDNWGKDNEANWGTLNTEINNLHFRGKVETVQSSYADYYKNIYQAINVHEELNVKPEQAKNVIRIIETAIKSNNEKRNILF